MTDPEPSACCGNCCYWLYGLENCYSDRAAKVHLYRITVTAIDWCRGVQ